MGQVTSFVICFLMAALAGKGEDLAHHLAIGEAVEPGADVFEDEKAATQPVDGQLAPSVEGEETRKRLIPFAPGAQDVVRLPRPEIPRHGHGFAAIRRICPVKWSRPDGPYLDEPEARE